MKGSVILCLFIVISSISLSQETNVTPGKASFQGLGDLPGGEFSSSAQGLSADGKVIVGFGATSSGEEAFRWTEETGLVILGNLPDKSFKKSWANKVSADGNVIVGYGDPVGQGWNTYKGFVWTSSEGMREIGPLDTSKRSMAFCVSGDGTIIAGDGGPAAFKWTKESQTTQMGVLPGRTHSRIIGMSANGKVMIGQSYSLPAWDDEDGFIMKEDGTMQSLASLTGGKYCMVLCMSPDGSAIAGTTHTSSFPAFFWTNEKGFVNIGHLPERNTTHPGDMTPFGKIIVGGSFSGPDDGNAFIWDGIQGMRNLQTVLEKEYGLDLTGWKLQNATGITPDGNVIVGTGINPQGKKEGFRVILDAGTGHDLSRQENTPILKYSTLIGGSGWDYGHGIAVDDSGYVYVAGQVNSSDYPVTKNSFDNSHNGNSDILLTKLNQNGSALIYSTYIGGSGRDDTRKVFIDKKGCVYLSGSTESADFPISGNALTGNSKGYYLKVNAAGDSLLYSSRWVDGGNVMTDLDGNLVIVGTTPSPDFPTTENAFCRKFTGDKDIFITKIDPIHNKVVFSTLIGGAGNDWAPAMTIDNDNNIIIAGRTNSEDFPLKGPSYGAFTQGKFNIMVTKLKPDGSELVYSTLIGGTDDDWAFDITSDKNNDVYITGVTKSGDFPVSKNAFDTSYNGGDDAILLKLSSDGKEIKYATFLGGSLKDGGRGVAVDENGRAYLTGCTRSTDFPVSDDAYDKTFNGAGTESWAWGDPFLFVMNPEGTRIEYSTYLGGSSDEEAYGIAMDPKGDIYICGVTSSDDFPTTEGAYDRTKNGNTNIYVAKFQFFDSLKR